MVWLFIFGAGGMYFAIDAVLFNLNITKFTSKYLIAPLWRFVGWILLFFAAILLIIGFKIAFSFKPDSKELSSKAKENIYKMIK